MAALRVATSPATLLYSRLHTSASHQPPSQGRGLHQRCLHGSWMDGLYLLSMPGPGHHHSCKRNNNLRVPHINQVTHISLSHISLPCINQPTHISLRISLITLMSIDQLVFFYVKLPKASSICTGHKPPY